MTSRKRSREGRNLTQEKKAKVEVRAQAVASPADPELMDGVRKFTMIQSKDRRGEVTMAYKHYLKGCDMEAILELGDAGAIAHGLVEAMRRGMRVEADAQVVLAYAEPSSRKQLAEAFAAQAQELALSASEHEERLARFLEAMARRISLRTKPKREPRKAKAKPERLEAVVDRALALGDAKSAAKVIAEAKLVDDDVQQTLERLAPELARELAINLRRRARKAQGGKARFLKALANRIEPTAVAEFPKREQGKRRAA